MDVFDAGMASENDVAMINLPMKDRFGTDGGMGLFVCISVVPDDAAELVLAMPRDERIGEFFLFALQLWDECRLMLIVEADGGASMNLLVMGSAVFFRNSNSDAFVEMPKLAARVDRLRKSKRILSSGQTFQNYDCNANAHSLLTPLCIFIKRSMRVFP